METQLPANSRDAIREGFITTLESKLHKALLLDWALGRVLDMCIDEVIERQVPEAALFNTLFSLWREKCLKLCTLVKDHHDVESHMYMGIDLSKLSTDDCQRWRVRFGHFSEVLGIE